MEKEKRNQTQRMVGIEGTRNTNKPKNKTHRMSGVSPCVQYRRANNNKIGYFSIFLTFFFSRAEKAIFPFVSQFYCCSQL